MRIRLILPTLLLAGNASAAVGDCTTPTGDRWEDGRPYLVSRSPPKIVRCEKGAWVDLPRIAQAEPLRIETFPGEGALRVTVFSKLGYPPRTQDAGTFLDFGDGTRVSFDCLSGLGGAELECWQPARLEHDYGKPGTYEVLLLTSGMCDPDPKACERVLARKTISVGESDLRRFLRWLRSLLR